MINKNKDLILDGHKLGWHRERVEAWLRGERIGLCIGAYDLLHAEHMTHLRSAKTLCDFLLIGTLIRDLS
jgi:bifunctional ADP-heptose synthase (sugar kinase/adenylyltransferase)